MLEFKQGHTKRVLTAIENHGNETIYVKNFTGAFIEVIPGKNQEDKPTLKYVQNLTIDSSFNGAAVAPGDSLSLAYDFFAFTSLPAPRTYTLQLIVFYSDSQYEYTSVVYNNSVHVSENTEDFSIITSTLSLILFSSVLLLIGFVIYVKIEDRMCPRPEEKKKSKKVEGVNPLHFIRELVSSQSQQ